ncbi:nitroreductase [Acinetobacter albensis]|uniref:Nitroreductase n=1 Tax=Acinetobacter albensis TaxID=1673609 RepID=A0ABW9JQ51_9GAMM
MDTKQMISALVNSRQSIRAFTDQAISQDEIQEILELASRAPSGTNIQPWKVYVVQGNKKVEIQDAVKQAVIEVSENPELKGKYEAAFQYYPKQWFEPYLSRRRANGWGLYNLLDIQKHEKQKMHAHLLRNFEFFGAPVGVFFTAHENLHVSAKMAIAMFMQTFMLVAKAYGFDSCPQAAWNDYHEVILPLVGANPDEQLICGLALGYADPQHIINQYYTPRIAVQDFTVFLS